jgi:hypothetical protein
MPTQVVVGQFTGDLAEIQNLSRTIGFFRRSGEYTPTQHGILLFPSVAKCDLAVVSVF